MRDTDRAFEQHYLQKIMERSGAERLRMDDGMFASGRAISLAGLSDVNDEEKRFRLFLRFYGKDFPSEQVHRIKSRLLGLIE